MSEFQTPLGKLRQNPVFSHNSIMAKEGEDGIDIFPTSITNLQNRTTVNWYFLACDQISAIHRNPNSSPGREIASGLHDLGLGTFVQDAWKWQYETLCEDFVRNFDHARMTTTAFGMEIDLSLATFVSLTGLSSNDADELYPEEEEPCLGEFALSWKKFFGSDSYDARSKGFALSKCKDSNLRLLIETLNDTAWLRILPRKYKHASKHLVYLVCHCVLEKKKKVNWGKTIHKKFVDELARLYMILFSNKKEKPNTRAGPLMCFLFSKFMQPFRDSNESSTDGFSDPLGWENSPDSQPIFTEEKMLRESSELPVEASPTEEKWDEERESRSSWEEVQIGTEGEEELNTTGVSIPAIGQKGALSTAVDKIMKLVELSPPRKKVVFTFAELYLEEQKHAEECLKGKLTAERTVDFLRAELTKIKRQQQQQNITTVSTEEQFAKHQVTVLRQRLEKSILERDQARAENRYLRMQLKEISVQLKNQAQKQDL